jgi:hypothetical protein
MLKEKGTYIIFRMGFGINTVPSWSNDTCIKPQNVTEGKPNLHKIDEELGYDFSYEKQLETEMGSLYKNAMIDQRHFVILMTLEKKEGPIIS